MIKQKQKGSSLIDVIVGTAIMVVIFVGIFGIFKLSIELVSSSKAKAGALALANEQVEFLRSLSYDDVGTIGGIPAGNIPQEEIIALNQSTYTRRTFIQYVDDPKDGLGEQDNNNITADYKRAKVEIKWTIGNRTRKFSLVSNIVPKGVETLAGGGILNINIIDAFGIPLAGAEVNIKNINIDPAIDLTTFSDSSGKVTLPGTPAGGGYEIVATKDGYSVAKTYDADANNPNPNPGHLTVVEGETTSLSFAIDLLSNMNVNTYRKVFTYFVRKTGNDSNNGLTPALAFATIGKASSVMNIGDRVYVGAGIYNESVAPAKSGILGAPISYIADTGGNATGDAGAVILDGYVNGGTGDLCYAFDLSAGRNYLIIDGFQATRYRDCNGNDATFYFVGNSNNNIYRNLIAHDTRRDGIAVGGTNNLLENCLVYNVGDDSLTMGRYSVVSKNKVRNCTFSGNIGIDTGSGGHAIEFDFITDGTNVFENNIIDSKLGWNLTDWNDEIWNYNNWTKGSLQGTGNFSADPLFVSTSTNNYRLQQISSGQSTTSTAVDAGSDVASLFNLDLQTTKTNESFDEGLVDIGYHYIVTDPLFTIPAPPTFGNIAFSMRGDKTIGLDNVGIPIYKYLVEHQTDSTGKSIINGLEWDNYTITINDAVIGYDIAESCPPQPRLIAPNISTTTNLFLVQNTTHSLLVAITNDTGALLPDANVRLYRTGYDDTKATSSCGQVFWGGLSKGTIAGGNPYSIDVSLPGYKSATVPNVSVDYVSGITIQLEAL